MWCFSGLECTSVSFKVSGISLSEQHCFQFTGDILVVSFHELIGLHHNIRSCSLRECCYINKLFSSHSFVFHVPGSGILRLQVQMYHPGSFWCMLVKCYSFFRGNNYPSLVSQSLSPLLNIGFNSIINMVVRGKVRADFGRMEHTVSVMEIKSS